MKRNLKYFLIILIDVIILSIPLFSNKYYVGHDTFFHYINILDITKSINILNIFPNIITTFIGNGFGYGVRLMYPVFPHLLTSILYTVLNLLFKVNISECLKLIHVLVFLLSGVTSYFLSLKIFKSKPVALLTALIYMSSNYLTCEIYIRDALCESFIFVVLPLIIFALFELVNKNYKKFLLIFTISYVIGIYSHLLTMFFITILLIPFFIIYRKEIFNKKSIKYLFVSCIIILFICSPYIVTLLEYKISGKYVLFSEIVGNKSLVINSTVSLNKYFFHEEVVNKIFINISITVIILFIFSIVYFIKNFKDKDLRKKELFLLITLIISFVMSLNIFPWENMPKLFYMIQFPWRLNIVICLMISLFAPTVLLGKFNNKIRKVIIIIIVFCLLVFSRKQITFWADDINRYEITYNDGMGHLYEYLPINTYNNLSYYKNRNKKILVNDDAKIKVLKDNVPNLTFEVKKIKGKTVIELPRIYYLGYSLKSSSGKSIKLIENDKGFIQTTIYKKGKYYLTYDKTFLEKVSEILSLLSIIVFIYLYLRKDKVYEKKQIK